MSQATWGDWFVREELEQAEPSGMAVWYLGCNGFVIRTETTTVYIDPYFGMGNPPRLLRMSAIPMQAEAATECDGVLVTHEHLDHMHPPSYEPLVKDLGADLYAPSASYDKPDCDVDTEGHEEKFHTVDVGDTFSIGDLTIHVCAANDPDAIEPVSYVVVHDSGTFFHGGDTRPSEAFTDIGHRFDIDAGVLAFGSVGRRYYPGKEDTITSQVYMDENQTITAANDLRIDRLLPTHYGMWKGLDGDPKSLHEHATSFGHPRSIEMIKLGDRVDLDEYGIKPLGILDH